MNKQLKLAATVAAMAMALAGGNAGAESSYGASTTTGAAVSATATVRINVTTPKLILLRVGAPNTQTVLDFNVEPTIVTSPTPITVMGNNQTANWNGAAPTFTVAPVGAVAAYLWHNNSGNAELTCAVSTTFTTGLAATDILVASAAGMAHPGTDTGCGATTPGLARNTVHTGSWTYSLDPAAPTNAMPGNDLRAADLHGDHAVTPAARRAKWPRPGE